MVSDATKYNFIGLNNSFDLPVGVGKSCIMKRLTENEFKEDHDVTVGVEFGAVLMKVEDHPLRLQIWDTAG